MLERAPIFSNNQENWWNNGNDYVTDFQVRNVTVELSSTDTTSNNINKKTFENTDFENYYYQSGKDIATIPYGKIDVDTWEYEITDESGGNDISVLLGGDASGNGATGSVTFYFQPKYKSNSHKIIIRWRVSDTEGHQTSNYIYENYTLKWNSWLDSNDLFNSWIIKNPENGQAAEAFVVEWKNSNITSPKADLGSIEKLHDFMNYNKSEFFGRGRNPDETIYSLRDSISFWEKVADAVEGETGQSYLTLFGGSRDVPKKSYLRSIDEISLPSMGESGPVGYTVNLKIDKSNIGGWATPFGICYFGKNKDDNTHYSGLKDGWILKFDPSGEVGENRLAGTLKIIKLAGGSTTDLEAYVSVDYSDISNNIDLELKIVKSEDLYTQGYSSGWIHIGAIYRYNNDGDRILLNSISLVHALDNTVNLGFQNWDVSEINGDGKSKSKQSTSTDANVDPDNDLTNGGFVSVFVEPPQQGASDSSTELWIESIKISGATYCIAKYDTDNIIKDPHNVDLKGVYTLYSWVDPGAEREQELYPAGELHGEMDYSFKWVVVDLLGEYDDEEKSVTVKATGDDLTAPTAALIEWLADLELQAVDAVDAPDDAQALLFKWPSVVYDSESRETNLNALREETGLLPKIDDITATDDYAQSDDDILIQWRVWFYDGERFNPDNGASFPDNGGWTNQNPDSFPKKLGTYKIQYKVSDAQGNANEDVEREIHIEDDANPTIVGINFNNGETVKYDQNSSKITIGIFEVTCNDNRLNSEDLEVYFKVDGLIDWGDTDYDISTDTVKTFLIRYKVQKYDRNKGVDRESEVIRYIQIEEVDADNWWPSIAVGSGESLRDKYPGRYYETITKRSAQGSAIEVFNSTEIRKLLYAHDGTAQRFYGGTVNVIMYNFSADCLNGQDVSSGTGVWIWYLGHEDGIGLVDGATGNEEKRREKSMGFTIEKNGSWVAVRMMSGGYMRDWFNIDNFVSGSTRYDILFSLSMARADWTKDKMVYALHISKRLSSAGEGTEFTEHADYWSFESSKDPFSGKGDHSAHDDYTQDWTHGLWVGGTAKSYPSRAFSSNTGVSFRASILSMKSGESTNWSADKY